ncbi:unnamed protein product, partial [Penicillium egyptiacum]
MDTTFFGEGGGQHHPAEPQGGDAQPGPLLTPDEFREHLPPGMRRAFDRFPDFLK